MAISARAATLARIGEDRAAAHVEDLGWTVVDRNWRCRLGELDVVAHDPATDTLVFIEVKCRSGYGYGHPLEAVTDAKLARLRVLALAWLREKDVHAARLRLDAIGIVVRAGAEIELTHVRGVGES